MDVRAVVVVVPVHNEAELLGRCLAALDAAVAAAEVRGIRCVVRIVLDACTDESAVIAAHYRFPIIALDVCRVGEARARGIRAAMRELADVPAGRVWIANTDADSAVPPNWITVQADLAERGGEVFVGTVRPDFADLSPQHRRHWLRTHPPGTPNGHVHGANLGMRADIYAAAGGFQSMVEHEDVELIQRCERLGAALHASDTAEVLTSGRFVGRTPGGYAGYLRTQAAALIRPRPVSDAAG
jgi:glycosyltransferase involved in cell wall biosynthesis